VKAERPSRTAQFVTLGRALADAGLSHVPDFHDPTARVFLTERGKRSLARTQRAVQEGKRTMARVMADLMALRTAAIDSAVRAAIAAGTKQLVILGAGYDGRAWRMPELAGVKVFEVDQAITQTEKRARVGELPPSIGTVSFVPMNFKTDSLATPLERAGHDRSLPTCWIWEGVVMYLTHAVMRATLAQIGARSAPGSTLIVNYHTAHRRLFARIIFRLIGEPQISASEPEDMAADLRAAGFLVSDDSGMVDWNHRFAGGGARVDRGRFMRIVVARSAAS
jgi:methyltransferase (TIGR00027 family)